MSVQIVYWTSYKVAIDRFFGIYCGTEYRVQQYFGIRTKQSIESIKMQQSKGDETITARLNVNSIKAVLAENDLLSFHATIMN